MKTTDIVFYLSLLAGIGNLFVKMSTNLISATTASWIGVICAIISFIAFAFYEQLTGTLPPPSEPKV